MIWLKITKGSSTGLAPAHVNKIKIEMNHQNIILLRG